MRFKKRYGVIKEDKQKNNGDWVFDSPTDRCFFEITAKNEREFDIFAEEIKSHGYEPSLVHQLRIMNILIVSIYLKKIRKIF